MTDKINWVEDEVKFKSIDIPSMANLSDADYESFINSDLFYVDHHEILRDSLTGHPIASSTEQVDILIGVLRQFKSRMVPREGNNKLINNDT